MADTTTLRIRTHTRDALNRLAQEDQVSATEFLDRLIAREEQSRLLAAMNNDFSNLRQDPAAWEEFKAETAAWDAASAPA
jgi:hypothetical protein